MENKFQSGKLGVAVFQGLQAGRYNWHQDNQPILLGLSIRFLQQIVSTEIVNDVVQILPYNQNTLICRKKCFFGKLGRPYKAEEKYRLFQEGIATLLL